MKMKRLLILVIAINCIARLAAQADSIFFLLHRDILQTKCAVPACHDGSFEPDFRTLSSAWNTTVWQPIKKNNHAKAFTYRVVPFHPEMSVLFERITNCCFVNKDDRMPFTVGITLTPEEIAQVRDWITTGAKDVNGNLPLRDTVFQLPGTSAFYDVYADSTAKLKDEEIRKDHLFYGELVLNKNMRSIILRFTTEDSLSCANTYTASLGLYTTPDYSTLYKSFAAGCKSGRCSVKINREALSPGQTYYFRLQLENRDADATLAFPYTTSYFVWKRHWAIRSE
ncbi:MAG: hypothetical protein U0V74_12080 [Chitinophagales bacterium]